MKTKSSIQMEYQQVMRQVRELNDCADELADAKRKLEALVNNLRSGWEGESAQAYINKCEELESKIKTSGRDLEKTADVIQRTAKIYRDAELAALALIQN